MNADYAQRRRVAVAVAITAIAVPAGLLLSRSPDDAGTSPSLTVVGTVPSTGPAAVADPDTHSAPSATHAMGTTPVAYLDGTAPPHAADAPTIAIPRPGQAITGTASFSRRITAPEACQVIGVAFNSTVTITNLDNSRSVRCINSIGGTPGENDVVLSDATFLQLADLTDAPILVEITW